MTQAANLAALGSNATSTGGLNATNLGTPSAINLTNATALPAAALPTGSVLQVVFGSTNTNVDITATTFTDTTLTATITPRFSTSKILVTVQQAINMYANSTYCLGGIRLVRNGTAIFNPNVTDNSGPYGFGVQATGASYARLQNFIPMNYLDSPASTSALTYKTQGRPYVAGQTLTVQGADSVQNGTSTIILMEIAG